MSVEKKKQNIFKRMIAWLTKDNPREMKNLSHHPMKRFERDLEIQRFRNRNMYRS